MDLRTEGRERTEENREPEEEEEQVAGVTAAAVDRMDEYSIIVVLFSKELKEYVCVFKRNECL